MKNLNLTMTDIPGVVCGHDLRSAFTKILNELKLSETEFNEKLKLYYDKKLAHRSEVYRSVAMHTLLLELETNDASWKAFGTAVDALGLQIKLTIGTDVDVFDLKDTAAAQTPEQIRYDAYTQTDIKVLGLPLRVENVLRHSGNCNTVGDVEKLTEAQVRKIHHMGDISTRVTITALEKVGRKLADPKPK